MKQYLKIGALLFILSIFTTSCHWVRPDGDEEAVLTKQPWFFGHGGVDSEPVATGSTFCAMTTSSTTFKIIPITYVEQFQDMISSDNTPVHFNSYIRIRIKKGLTPTLLSNFGKDWYSNNIGPTFRTYIRDKVSSYPMFQLTTKRELVAKLQGEIFKEIVTYTKALSLPVVIEEVTIGAITPPDEVLNETKKTAAQNQAELTELSRAKSEIARKQAEINKGIADKAYKEELGLTNQEWIQMKQIAALENNKNATFIMGNDVQPVLPIK